VVLRVWFLELCSGFVVVVGWVVVCEPWSSPDFKWKEALIEQPKN
jgi:hypothetical protein